MIELLAVIGVSMSLSVLSNVLSRRLGIGAYLRRSVERAALEALERRPLNF